MYIRPQIAHSNHEIPGKTVIQQSKRVTRKKQRQEIQITPIERKIKKIHIDED